MGGIEGDINRKKEIPDCSVECRQIKGTQQPAESKIARQMESNFSSRRVSFVYRIF